MTTRSSVSAMRLTSSSVVRFWFGEGDGVDGVVAGVGELSGEAGGVLCVDEELHRVVSGTWRMRRGARAEFECGEKVVAFEIGVVVEDFLDRHASGEELEEVLDGIAQAADGRLTMTDQTGLSRCDPCVSLREAYRWCRETVGSVEGDVFAGGADVEAEFGVGGEVMS